MPRRTVFLDTSYLLALENQDDPCHSRAKALECELSDQGCDLFLHWGILLEIADVYARLSRRQRTFQLFDRFENDQGYLIRPINESLLAQALNLYQSRSDKEWGLTDCISFVLMRQERISEAVTSDKHFRQAGFVALLLEP